MNISSMKLALLVVTAAVGAGGFSVGPTPTNKRVPTRIHSARQDDDVATDRRTFLATGSAISLLAALPDPSQARGGVDYRRVSGDIADLIAADPDKGPTLVRLAWHSSGTYDKMTKTGGSGLGTIRFKEELAHGGNAGLAGTAVEWMEPIHEKYAADGLSYADLYTLAGVTAIKALGGPTIPWSSGRVDSVDPADVTPDGRLPSADVGEPGSDGADADHLRSIFYRMGFDDREIVALSGAHALGRCHTTASGYDGPWTATPTVFNNAYYKFLSTLDWKKKEWDGPYQYVAGPQGRFMMLPSDLVLVQDKEFSKWVDVYAKDNDLFFNDFSKAFNTLEELGTKKLKKQKWA